MNHRFSTLTACNSVNRQHPMTKLAAKKRSPERYLQSIDIALLIAASWSGQHHVR